MNGQFAKFSLKLNHFNTTDCFSQISSRFQIQIMELEVTRDEKVGRYSLPIRPCHKVPDDNSENDECAVQEGRNTVSCNHKNNYQHPSLSILHSVHQFSTEQSDTPKCLCVNPHFINTKYYNSIYLFYMYVGMPVL